MNTKEAPGWFDRTISKPEHMEASLRYMTVLPRDTLGSAGFTFPWHRKIYYEDFYLHCRRTGERNSQSFCLDLGQFTGDIINKWPVFQSSAWLDFDITPKKSHCLWEAGNDHLIGKASREKSVNNFNPLYTTRPDFPERHPVGHWGIYVSDTLRGQKIGTGLISAARIILNQVGVKTLVIEEIAGLEEKDLRKRFYDSLDARTFDLYKESYVHTREKVLCGKAAYPTRETQRCPYRFE